MNRFLVALLAVSTLFTSVEVRAASAADLQTGEGIIMKSIDGTPRTLSDYKGKVVLVVNVASRCGFTPQYEALEKLFQRYEARGFVVLGFPSNDFGEQEPGSNEDIKKFCKLNYGVTFPLFEKGKVLGPDKQPIYAHLIGATGGAEVEWNFEKFLLARDGSVVGRFKSSVKPDADELTASIEKELTKP